MKKKRWAELVEGYFSQERNISLVVQIMDFRHSPTKDDLHMIDFLLSNGFNFVVALTKSDKLNKTERANQLELMESLFDDKKVKYVVCSSLNGEGMDELRNIIESNVKINLNSVES